MGHAANEAPLVIPHRLSTVVGTIYDCAIDPERWREALRELCVDLRCMLSAIYLFDAQNSSVRHVTCSDLEAERIVRDKDYVDTAMANLRLLPIATQPVDEPFASSQIVTDYSAFMGSRYFREVSIPQGYGDGMHVVLGRNSQRVALFSATRHLSEGRISEDDLAILRLFAPHIRRAVTIGDLLELKALEAESLSATLDR